MALSIGTLVGYLRLDNADFEKKMASAGERMKTTGKNLEDTGKKATMGLSLPIVGVGLTAIKMSGDFETSMLKVKAISGATGEQFDAMREQAKELGATTQFSASEAADAMGFLAMAGFDATQTMDALPGVLDLAAAGSLDLASAADIASNILSGYGMEVEALSAVNDTLAKTFTSTNVDMRMLGESFKYVGPVASGAGLRFDEVAAAIGLLGNAGIQGSEAGTALRGAIARLLKPTTEVEQTLKKLGVTTHDSEGNLHSLYTIFEQLESQGASTADMISIFGLEAGPGMAAILSQGTDALFDLTAELEKADGTAGEIAKTQMSGFKGSLDEMTSAFEGLMISIGESGLLDIAVAGLDKLGKMFEWLAGTPKELKVTLMVIAGVLAAIGPTMTIVGKAMQAWTLITKIATAAQWLLNIALNANPIGLVVLAVALLIGIFILLWVKFEGFRNFWKKTWELIQKAAIAVWDFIVAAAKKWWSTFSGFWRGVGKFFSGLWDGLVSGVKKAWSWVTDRFDKAVAFMKGIPGKIKSGFSSVKDIVSSPFKSAFNAIASFWNRTAGKLSFKMPDWVPGLKGKGFSMPQLPMLAKGGRIVGDGLAIVGEAGPELVHLRAGAAVQPLSGGGAGGGGGGTLRIVGELRARGSDLVVVLRETVAGRGGNVQAVVGTSS